MRERLLASRSDTDALCDAGPDKPAQRVTDAEAEVEATRDRFEQIVEDPDTPDHILEGALRGLRVARLHADLARIEPQQA